MSSRESDIAALRGVVNRQPPLSSRTAAGCAPTNPTLRPVPLAPTDVNVPPTSFSAQCPPAPFMRDSHPGAAIPRTSSSTGRTSSSFMSSPQADRRHMEDPHYVAEYMKDIMEGLFRAEQRISRESYLPSQPELSEKMRMILVDWLVEVHLKFKCRPETLFLAVDIVDRFLAVQRTTRSTLQLVGVTSMLLAAKYEEIWPPEVKDCVYISANTYTRDEVLKMERSICVVLQFRLTVPNCQHFVTRLLDVYDADAVTRHLAMFYAETSLLCYQLYSCRPSIVGAACVLLANVSQSVPEPFNHVLQYYSRHRAVEVTEVARRLLEFTHGLVNSKYAAVRRKYSGTKYGEVGLMPLPSLEALNK